jgi:ethanolamine ammonia-lyase small subunit
VSELAQAGIAARLRALTPARVGLGRTGVSLETREVLGFQLSHARARDAVHARMNAAALAAEMERVSGGAVVRLHSAARDRAEYLQRPDFGRALDEAARVALAEYAGAEFDLVFVVADGLSALAVERHVVPLLEELLPGLAGWKIAPIAIVEQGRVAVGDAIGELIGARMAVVLIGERPGLSSPDSLGAYVTWEPRVGRTDAERVCVSNIRAEGLNYMQAAEQLVRVLDEARRMRLTGVALSTKAIAAEAETL